MFKPGTDIVFTITIDTSICPYTKQDIIESINYFDDNYNKYFVEPFTAVEYIGDESVFLGGGSGYASKTAVYPLFDGEDSEQTVRIVQQIMVNTTTLIRRQDVIFINMRMIYVFMVFLHIQSNVHIIMINYYKWVYVN